MIRIFSLLLFLISASLCFAEVAPYDIRQPQHDGVILVGIECHHRNHILELGLFFPSNPPTKRMDLWNLSDLVRFNPKTYDLEKTEIVERRCKIKDSQYKVRFEGVPGASNAMSMCGAGTGVHATVWKNEKIVFDDDLYICHRDEYIGIVRFKDDIDAPEVKRHSMY